MISAFLGLAVSAALAQAGGAVAAGTEHAASAPGASVYSREVANFDFEERALGNFESVPMYWSKLVGRGYPAYATGRFDTSMIPENPALSVYRLKRRTTDPCPDAPTPCEPGLGEGLGVRALSCLRYGIITSQS